MFYDCHVHTNFSADAKATVEEHCQRAIELGLKGISFTDHYEPIATGMDFSHIRACAKKAEELQEKVPFRIFRGVELGDCIEYEKEQKQFLKQMPLDIVLGSIHTALTFRQIGYPHLFHSEGLAQLDEKETDRFLVQYYKNVLALVQKADIDVLTHLTLPLRYLNGRYHRNITLDKNATQIEQILKVVVDRGIALEINTSGAETQWGYLLPDKEWLELYYSLGGRRITLGSDAHIAEKLGRGLSIGAKVAKEVGFTHYCYFEKRIPVEVSL